MPEYIGVDEFAQILGCTYRYALKLIRDGKAPRHIKFGKKIRFAKEDVLVWVKAYTVNPENK